MNALEAQVPGGGLPPMLEPYHPPNHLGGPDRFGAAPNDLSWLHKPIERNMRPIKIEGQMLPAPRLMWPTERGGAAPATPWGEARRDIYGDHSPSEDAEGRSRRLQRDLENEHNENRANRLQKANVWGSSIRTQSDRESDSEPTLYFVIDHGSREPGEDDRIDKLHPVHRHGFQPLARAEAQVGGSKQNIGSLEKGPQGSDTTQAAPSHPAGTTPYEMLPKIKLVKGGDFAFESRDDFLKAMQNPDARGPGFDVLLRGTAGPGGEKPGADDNPIRVRI